MPVRSVFLTVPKTVSPTIPNNPSHPSGWLFLCRKTGQARICLAPFQNKNPFKTRTHLRKEPMTKEEIIAAIKECAEKLGHAPSYPELRGHFRVNEKTIRRHFGKYKWALDACGLEPYGAGYEIPMEKLFRDWAGIIRKTGQIPSQNVYEAMSQFSVNPLMSRYRSWLNVPLGLLQYAESNGLSVEFGDVLDAVRGQFKKE